MSDLFVCLTFDHDNASANISRNLTTPTMISRGDFGIAAVPRILKLLGAHDIETTWFIPGHTIESYPSCANAVFEAGHEIAHHGWTHRLPATLTREGEEEELLRGTAAIEALTGRKPRGWDRCGVHCLLQRRCGEGNGRLCRKAWWPPKAVRF